MGDRSPTDLARVFHDKTLPKPEWTHEAHLIVCWCALREMDVEDAIPYLRNAIRGYNEAVGTPNTDSSGYHETLTRYYVEAVAQFVDQPIEDVFGAAQCRREALFSVAARRSWLDPDLTELPWR